MSICLNSPESISHALGSCKAAQVVWSLGSRRLQKSSVTDGPFKEVLEQILIKLSPKEICEVALCGQGSQAFRRKLELSRPYNQGY